MEIIIQFLLFSSFIFIFFSISTQSANPCKPESCGGTGPQVRFPFRFKTRKPSRCGYPGFELSCNKKNETTLKLPAVSGEFKVNSIHYRAQSLSLSYTGPCLAGRILDFNLSGSPFRGAYASNYTFLNCSSAWEEIMGYASIFNYMPIDCLSEGNHTVLAASSLSPADIPAPSTCRRITNVLFPVKPTAGPMANWPPVDQGEEIELIWSDPACSHCEEKGRVCGFKNDSSLETGCYGKSSGVSRKVKYGLIIGLGIPGLVCIIGLVCHICGLIKVIYLRQGRGLDSELPMVALPDARLVTNGLDGPTIESYPKTVIGESGRLPESSDGTCPICLSEYQPKDTLRSIPECNHYFHVGCIDEWLKLNGTCPLCRKSPEDGSIVTSCSSLSSSLITTSSTPSSGRL